jgi:hypothetical protein
MSVAAMRVAAPDEDAWVCDIREAPGDIVAALVARACA